MNIKITYQTKFLVRGPTLNVLLDGNSAGRVPYGKSIELNVSDEIHSLAVTDSICCSNSIVVDGTKKTKVAVEVGTTMGGWKAFFILIILLLGSPTLYYIKIKQPNGI